MKRLIPVFYTFIYNFRDFTYCYLTKLFANYIVFFCSCQYCRWKMYSYIFPF